MPSKARISFIYSNNKSENTIGLIEGICGHISLTEAFNLVLTWWSSWPIRDQNIKRKTFLIVCYFHDIACSIWRENRLPMCLAINVTNLTSDKSYIWACFNSKLFGIDVEDIITKLGAIHISKGLRYYIQSHLLHHILHHILPHILHYILHYILHWMDTYVWYRLARCFQWTLENFSFIFILEWLW